MNGKEAALLRTEQGEGKTMEMGATHGYELVLCQGPGVAKAGLVAPAPWLHQPLEGVGCDALL